MSDNLKVAKECGAIANECAAVFSAAELDVYTSRRLASQQAAHEAEIARLKEEVAHYKKQGADRLIGLCKCGIEREELQQQVSEWERKQLEPLRAQVAMLTAASTQLSTHIRASHLCGPTSTEYLDVMDSAIGNTQATAEQFKAECEQRGAVKALEDVRQHVLTTMHYTQTWNQQTVLQVIANAQLRATSKKAG